MNKAAKINELLTEYRKARNEYVECKNREQTGELLDAISAIENKIKKLFPIEIQNPEQIIACRVTTGYRGKLGSVDINNLNKLWLSAGKQMGNIYTNYKLDFDGKGTLTDKQYIYRIQRKDGKVYWLFDMYELASRYVE